VVPHVTAEPVAIDAQAHLLPKLRADARPFLRLRRELWRVPVQAHAD